MQDPAFQAHCQKMMESAQFKQSINKTKEVMKDPKKVKELEAKVQQDIKEGQEALEKAEKAAKEMEQDGKKPAAKKEEEEEVEDVPNLNLN